VARANGFHPGDDREDEPRSGAIEPIKCYVVAKGDRGCFSQAQLRQRRRVFRANSAETSDAESTDTRAMAAIAMDACPSVV
jgi:hypothetical protein